MKRTVSIWPQPIFQDTWALVSILMFGTQLHLTKSGGRVPSVLDIAYT